jgi:hypothetical protein
MRFAVLTSLATLACALSPSEAPTALRSDELRQTKDPLRISLPRSVVLSKTVASYGFATLACYPLLPPDRVAARLRGPYAALHQLRAEHTLLLFLVHEVVTDIVADVAAQVIAAREARMVLDLRRALKTMLCSFLSDDLPFLLWSRLMWVGGERAVVAARASAQLPPRLVAALTHPLGVALAKMCLTQLLYETSSSTAYLALQAVAQGHGARGVARSLRTNLWRVWRDGLAFWSTAHLVVFALPAWWMQPVVDNLATLVFNTYLALVAHAETDADAEADAVALRHRMERELRRARARLARTHENAEATISIPHQTPGTGIL